MRTVGARGLVMLSLMLALPSFTQAQSPAEVPVGTKVALRFLTGLDSTTAVQDQRIDFRVAAPVTVHRRIVLREGAAAHGFVVSVIRETRLGIDGRIRIAFVETTAVDGHFIRFSRIEVTPASFRRSRIRSHSLRRARRARFCSGPMARRVWAPRFAVDGWRCQRVRW